MTKAERKRVLHRAAEIIATGSGSRFSCIAIDLADGGSRFSFPFRSQLREDYAKFFDKNDREYWWSRREERHGERNRHLRILLLLWFAEVGLEGIGEARS